MAKLVRDRIPEIIAASGKKPVVRTADVEEYKRLLRLKLVEESAEFSKEPVKEELADILEIVDSIIKTEGFDKNEIDSIRENKRKERGGFEKRIVLEKVD